MPPKEEGKKEGQEEIGHGAAVSIPHYTIPYHRISTAEKADKADKLCCYTVTKHGQSTIGFPQQGNLNP